MRISWKGQLCLQDWELEQKCEAHVGLEIKVKIKENGCFWTILDFPHDIEWFWVIMGDFGYLQKVDVRCTLSNAHVVAYLLKGVLK